MAASLLGAGLFAPAVAADEAADKDRARELIRAALDQLENGDFEAALASAREAEALYHAPVHLEAVGRALEGLGRLAEAADTYERLASEPLPPGTHEVFLEAQERARERLRELGAKVPSVLLRIHGTADDVQVWVDERELPYARGAARRVDAGERLLRVTAAGGKSHEQTLSLPAKGGVVVVEVSFDEGSAVDGPDSPPRAAGEEGSLVPAFVALGVGAVGLGVGGVTGLMSLGKAGDLEDRCPDKQCAPEDQDDFDSATTLGTVSTIGFIVGGVASVAGVVLLVVRPGGDDARDAGVGAQLKLHAGGIALDGRF